MKDIFEIRATYKEWQLMGCQVLKGQKHLGKNSLNRPVFEIWQTVPKNTLNFYRMLDKWERDVYDEFEILEQEFYH
jgi:hypothetical protein